MVTAAAQALGAATPVMPAHEHSRERDAGAETEVENDGAGFGAGGGGGRLPNSLRRRPLPAFDVVDLTEDADAEMEDVSGLPALPEDMDDMELDAMANGRRRDLSVSPDPGRANRSAELLFEPDGEGGGSSAEADAGASASDSSGNGEGILNSKRKR